MNKKVIAMLTAMSVFSASLSNFSAATADSTDLAFSSSPCTATGASIIVDVLDNTPSYWYLKNDEVTVSENWQFELPDAYTLVKVNGDKISQVYSTTYPVSFSAVLSNPSTGAACLLDNGIYHVVPTKELKISGGVLQDRTGDLADSFTYDGESVQAFFNSKTRMYDVDTKGYNSKLFIGDGTKEWSANGLAYKTDNGFASIADGVPLDSYFSKYNLGIENLYDSWQEHGNARVSINLNNNESRTTLVTDSWTQIDLGRPAKAGYIFKRWDGDVTQESNGLYSLTRSRIDGRDCMLSDTGLKYTFVTSFDEYLRSGTASAEVKAGFTKIPDVKPTAAPVFTESPTQSPTRKPDVYLTAKPKETATRNKDFNDTVQSTREPLASKKPKVIKVSPDITAKPVHNDTYDNSKTYTNEDDIKKSPSVENKLSIGKVFSYGSFTVKVTKKNSVRIQKGKGSGNVSVPNRIRKNNKNFKVVSIADKAFYKSKIKSVTIGSKVKNLGANSFAYCKRLKRVVFKGKILIGKHSFKGCNNVTFKYPKKYKKYYAMRIKKVRK